MSRWRSSHEDLAYGDIPQRWDRERFERFSRGGPPARFEDDFRFVERDSPGRRDVAVAERRESSRAGRRFEERDRFWEEDRVRSRPRRRTDKELFGEVDPREIAEMALVPARRKSITREDWDFDQREKLDRHQEWSYSEVQEIWVVGFMSKSCSPFFSFGKQYAYSS